MKFLDEARAAAPWMVDLRRQIHRRPELGNQEFETAAAVEAALASMGLKPRRLLETAVVCDIEGALPGPTVALRADLDALPLQEETGLPYASEIPGQMHACGHDFHVAGLLGAAKLLSARRDTLPSTVRLLFQPDEEGDGGARRLMEAGCLEGVACVFGAHVRPELPAGQVGVKYGPAYAASNPFVIRIKGRAAHGAEPQLGADALLAGAQIVTALQSIVARRVAPADSAVLTVGTFHAGAAMNILAGEAVLEGMLRTFGEEARRTLVDAVTDLATSIARGMGCEAEVRFTWGYPGIVNHDHETALVERTAQALLGPEAVTRHAAPLMTTEDFGYFLQAVPGCFYHVGVGCDAPLHAPRFAPDEKALPVLAALHAQVAWTALTEGAMDDN